MFAWLFPWRKPKNKFPTGKPTAVEPRIKIRDAVEPIKASEPFRLDRASELGVVKLEQVKSRDVSPTKPNLNSDFKDTRFGFIPSVGATGMMGPPSGMTGAPGPKGSYQQQIDAERRRKLFAGEAQVNNTDLLGDVVTTAEFCMLMEMLGRKVEPSGNMHIEPPEWHKDVPWEGEGGQFSGGGASGEWQDPTAHLLADKETSFPFAEPDVYLLENEHHDDDGSMHSDHEPDEDPDTDGDSDSDDSDEDDSDDDSSDSDDDDSSDDSSDSDDSSSDDSSSSDE